MKKIKFIPLALLLLLAGCNLFSLRPFYTESDLYLDDNLLGDWIDQKSAGQASNKITFVQSSTDDKMAYFFHTEEDQNASPTNMVCHLFKLGSYQYLDFFPLESSASNSDNLIKVHSLMRIELAEDSLVLYEVNPKKVSELCKNKKNSLDFAELENEENILLTGSTKQMQHFFRKHENEEELFVVATVLHRLR